MAEHYEEGARYTVAEDMPRWCGCFIQQGSTQVLRRPANSYTRPAPIWIGNTETDLLAGDTVTVEKREIEGQMPRYAVVKVSETKEANGAMFG